MRKFEYVLLIALIILLSCVSCDNVHDPSDTSHIRQDSIETQEFFDQHIKETVVINSQGHQVIFYECGSRYGKGYAFTIEHSVNCQKCLDLYD